MDFELSEEQLLLKKTVRDFATRELEPLARDIDEREEFPWGSVKKIADLGLMGLAISREYGGSEGDYIQLAIATEELARACAATAIIFIAHLSLGTQAIYRFASESQKKKYVPPLARGEKLAAFALTEPNSGSDAASIQTTAVRRGRHYILNGSKTFITNGNLADTVVVFATVDKALRSKGMCAFIVEKGAPGFTSHLQKGKLGMRASATAELYFQDTPVPEENLIEKEGKGLKVALGTIDASRIIIAAQAVGIAQGALEASLRYSQLRHQFNQPIADFQAIQWMLADMATQIDAARLLTYRAAYFKERGLPFSRESAMAKLFASEAAMAATTKAIQIHGGYGYLKDYPVERYFRDAKATEIYEGTSEVQRLVIARSLLSEGGKI